MHVQVTQAFRKTGVIASRKKAAEEAEAARKAAAEKAREEAEEARKRAEQEEARKKETARKAAEEGERERERNEAPNKAQTAARGGGGGGAEWKELDAFVCRECHRKRKHHNTIIKEQRR